MREERGQQGERDDRPQLPAGSKSLVHQCDEK